MKNQKKALVVVLDAVGLSTMEYLFGKCGRTPSLPNLAKLGLGGILGGKAKDMLSSRLKGKKLALIKSFVEFYTNKENQLAQVRELKRLPGLAAASQDPAVKNNPLLMASLSQVQVGRPM